MRICLSPGTIGGGGIGIVMLNLAEEFAVRGYTVDLLLLEEETDRAIPQGINAVMLGKRARNGVLRAARHLRRTRPDLVISARDYVNVLTLAAHRLARLGASSRLIWTFHTHHGAQLSGVPRLADRLAHRISRAAAPLVDALVAVSNGVARETEAALRLPRGKVAVIENPVWTPARVVLADADVQHPWFDGAEPVVLAIGRLVGQKDFPTLLDAFSRLQAEMPARLIILGEGEDRADLAAQIARLGLAALVDMPGHVANPLGYLSRADLFVLSSRWEGFPLSLVEALGCGCPVVSTDCPSGPDEILRGGDLGRLTPVGDAAKLAESMLATLRDPGDPVARKGAALQFTAGRAADLYLRAADLG